MRRRQTPPCSPAASKWAQHLQGSSRRAPRHPIALTSRCLDTLLPQHPVTLLPRHSCPAPPLDAPSPGRGARAGALLTSLTEGGVHLHPEPWVAVHVPESWAGREGSWGRQRDTRYRSRQESCAPRLDPGWRCHLPSRQLRMCGAGINNPGPRGALEGGDSAWRGSWQGSEGRCCTQQG